MRANVLYWRGKNIHTHIHIVPIFHMWCRLEYNFNCSLHQYTYCASVQCTLHIRHDSETRLTYICKPFKRGFFHLTEHVCLFVCACFAISWCSLLDFHFLVSHFIIWVLVFHPIHSQLYPVHFLYLVVAINSANSIKHSKLNCCFCMLLYKFGMCFFSMLLLGSLPFLHKQPAASELCVRMGLKTLRRVNYEYCKTILNKSFKLAHKSSFGVGSVRFGSFTLTMYSKATVCYIATYIGFISRWHSIYFKPFNGENVVWRPFIAATFIVTIISQRESTTRVEQRDKAQAKNWITIFINE